jgi:hypothetical protein
MNEHSQLFLQLSVAISAFEQYFWKGNYIFWNSLIFMLILPNVR